MPQTTNRRHRQLSLRYRTWGGRRRGAGRKPKAERAGVSHARRKPLAARFPVSVTMRILSDVAPLRAPCIYGHVLDALGEASGTRFRVVEFSVQDDHLHLLCEAADRQSLSRGIQGLSIRLARRLNRALGRSGKVFNDRYHDRILRTPREVRFALRYVLLNARKHGSLPARARPRWIDPYSSAPWFGGWRGATELPPPTPPYILGQPPPTAEARTWLLRRGWRRHGLLEPGDRPGPAPP